MSEDVLIRISIYTVCDGFSMHPNTDCSFKQCNFIVTMSVAHAEHFYYDGNYCTSSLACFFLNIFFVIFFTRCKEMATAEEK